MQLPRVLVLPKEENIVLNHWFIVNANVDLLTNYTRRPILQSATAFPSLYCANVSVQPLLHSSLLMVPMGRTPSKLPLSMGDLDGEPHVIHGSLGPLESATPQMASRSVQPFIAGLTSMTNRLTDTHPDRQTDRPCYRRDAPYDNVRLAY